MHRRHLREEAALAAVGAAVEDEAAAAGHEAAVTPGARLELDHHPLTAVVGRDELLLAREDELHGPAGRARECGHVALEVEVALGAEAAAEQRDDDAHVRLGELEDARDAGPRGVGNLSRAPDGHPVAVPFGEDRPRLDRRALRRLGHVAALHDGDDVGALDRPVGVALHDGGEAEDVALQAELLVGLVRLPVLVDERRAVCDRGLDVAHRRERLVLDLDRGGRGGRDLGARGGDGGDDVGLEAHLLAGEKAAILGRVAVEHVRHVLVREDGEHAGHGLRARRVDREDAGVRVVGVAELRVQLAGQVEVGRVPPRAGDLLLAVLAQEGGLLGDAHGPASGPGARGGCVREPVGSLTASKKGGRGGNMVSPTGASRRRATLMAAEDKPRAAQPKRTTEC